ncbi:MAG: hypothetical protein KTR22_07785 [Flavobacteriaceae bacterium]|nr:hypothetical protein [Flavobacteriaceae bacterium]
MRNESVWKAANTYSINTSVRYAWYSFLIPVTLYFLFPSYNFLGTVLGNTLLILLAFVATERYLNTHFDKLGNPKNHGGISET